MNRGMTILASFLGLGIMIFFVAALTGRGAFLVFLAFLPLIWVYGFFDAMQQLGKKEKGEELVDRSILEDFEMRHEEGKKSRAIATFLSIFPGAGHLYLGLQRRGIQLMAAFLFSIYILDILRLGIFLFLIPIIWFYSFFDGMQRASKMQRAGRGCAHYSVFGQISEMDWHRADCSRFILFDDEHHYSGSVTDAVQINRY